MCPKSDGKYHNVYSVYKDAKLPCIFVNRKTEDTNQWLWLMQDCKYICQQKSLLKIQTSDFFFFNQWLWLMQDCKLPILFFLFHLSMNKWPVINFSMSTRTGTSYYIVFDSRVYNSTKTENFAMIHYDYHCLLCVIVMSHSLITVNMISLSLTTLSRRFLLLLLLPDSF